MVQFITIVVILAIVAAVAQFLYHRKKLKDSLVELKCKFYLSDTTDELLNTYEKELGVELSGILGNDFMVDNDYIIDYESLQVRHKSVRISIKETMDILELPLIVLWQGMSKHTFLLDTGATTSLIGSRSLSRLKYNTVEGESIELQGFGGKGESSNAITTSLYYAKRKIRQEPL